MKTCTVYGCNAAALRNSEICFEHIKNGLALNPGVEVIPDRGAAQYFISTNNNTLEKVVFYMMILSAGNMSRMAIAR